MRTTDLFIIINEETLKIVSDEKGDPYRFKTMHNAEQYASENLEVWNVTRINFCHKFISHTTENDPVLQAENARKWILALQSGLFPQGKHVLGNAEKGFCCWGLGLHACGVDYDQNSPWDRNFANVIGYRNPGGTITGDALPESISVGQIQLGELNDDLDWNFEQISIALVENAHLNFNPYVAKKIKEEFE